MYQGQQIKRGEAVTGLPSLSAATGISVKKIRLRLKRLEKTKEISQKRAGKFSIITVCNYDEYQTYITTEGQAKGRQRAGKGQHFNNVNNDNNKNDQTESTFDLFWEEYPRKVSKKKAKQMWITASLGEKHFETIMSSLEKQKAQWNDPKYIPHPTTWLNQERWNDEAKEESAWF